MFVVLYSYFSPDQLWIIQFNHTQEARYGYQIQEQSTWSRESSWHTHAMITAIYTLQSVTHYNLMQLFALQQINEALFVKQGTSHSFVYYVILHRGMRMNDHDPEVIISGSTCLSFTAHSWLFGTAGGGGEGLQMKSNMVVGFLLD